MKSFATTGLYLDVHHQTKSGLLPLKVRVTYQRKSKYFKTGIALSKKAFTDSYLAKKPRGDNYHLKEKLVAFVRKSENIISDMNSFSFEDWKNAFYGIVPEMRGIISYYNEKISILETNNKFSTADTYTHSLALIEKHFLPGSNSEIDFADITPTKLIRLQKDLITEGYSISTIGIYLRCLRHIFNNALSDGIIEKSEYPFGSSIKKYSIPQSRNIKKALSVKDIKSLLNVNVSGITHFEKARDFWMLSFYCNGMNMNDILKLKHSNYDGDSLVFIRQKSRSTRKVIEPTKVILHPNAINVIEKHSTEGKYLFDVLNGENDPRKQRNKVKAFTRFINQHMEKVAELAGINSKCSLMYARHSYSTLAFNKGIPIEYISQSLSHESIQTTKNYIRGLSMEKNREITSTIFKDFEYEQ